MRAMEIPPQPGTASAPIAAGVLEVRVTLTPPVAEVTYDDAKTGPDQLTRAMANAGFPSTLRKQQ